MKKELGGWKTRSMVDRYAKFATEHLAHAASRLDIGSRHNVIELAQLGQIHQEKKGLTVKLNPFQILVAGAGIEPATRGFSKITL